MGVKTPEEREAKAQARCERDLHDGFQRYLNLHGVIYIHARMDKRSTIRKGAGDFVCLARGFGAVVEFKFAKGRMSAAQITEANDCGVAGVPYLLATNLKDAIQFIRTALHLDRPF